MIWQTYPIKGWAPDLSPTTPGYLAATDFVLPTERGIQWSAYPSALSSSVMATASLGGAVVEKIDGTKRIFAGVAAKLWEFDGGSTITDRSGAAYAATLADSWSFSQFGDITLAVNKVTRMQQISSGAAFADAATNAPKASIVITAGPANASFAMLFDYDDTVNNYKDGWFCSALSSPLDWTPSIATQCANSRLLDINGRITAAIAYRDGVLAFKDGTMYQGTYEGPPAIWAWRRVASDIGCIGKNAVCIAGDVAYWADEQGLWMFDGSYPQPMPGYINNWWRNTLYNIRSTLGNTDYAKAKNFVKAYYNKKLSLILFCIPTYDTNYHAGYVIAYNTHSGIWTQVCGGKSATNGLRNDANTLRVHEIIGTITNGFYMVGDDFKFGYWLTYPGTAQPNSTFSTHVVGALNNVTTLVGVRLGRESCLTMWGGDVPQTTLTTNTAVTVYHDQTLPDVLSAAADYSIAFTANTSGTPAGTVQGIASNVFLRPEITIDSSSANSAWEFSSVMLDIKSGGGK